MAMRFKDDEEDEIVAEINITPLTDIFLVLLIIFMISSSAMLEGGLNVKLPTAKSTALTKTTTGRPVYITLTKSGDIVINKETTPQARLRQALREALNETSDRTVVIRGDQAVYLGKAVEIMDAARDAGADKIALATQPPK